MNDRRHQQHQWMVGYDEADGTSHVSCMVYGCREQGDYVTECPECHREIVVTTHDAKTGGRLVVLTDQMGFYEPATPVPQSMVKALQREFSRNPWPPPKGLKIWGEPVEIEDRRKPEPTVARIEIDLADHA